MKRELDERLCSKYPSLFRDRHSDVQTTAMCWGFECESGWYTLIDVVSELLSEHSPLAYAVQVKEKYGTLRFYYNEGDRYTLGVEMTAQTLSGMLCEVCGDFALLVTEEDRGYAPARCKQHVSEYLVLEELELDYSKVDSICLGHAWATFMLMLMDACEWHTEKNGMPKTLLTITKNNGKLVVSHTGGDDFSTGVIDVIVHYANRVDEHTGKILADI